MPGARGMDRVWPASSEAEVQGVVPVPDGGGTNPDNARTGRRQDVAARIRALKGAAQTSMPVPDRSLKPHAKRTDQRPQWEDNGLHAPHEVRKTPASSARPETSQNTISLFTRPQSTKKRGLPPQSRASGNRRQTCDRIDLQHEIGDPHIG